MITNKSLLSFLSEAQDSQAAMQAKEMGLQSIGYGNWADPRTGQVTHRTVKGQLVPVAAKDQGGQQQAASPEDQPEEPQQEVEVQEPDPKDVETVARGLAGGRWNVASAPRQKQLMQIAYDRLLAQNQQAADAAAEQQAAATQASAQAEIEAQDAEMQRQQAAQDMELKSQEIERGKLEIQQQKDAIKQEKESRALEKAQQKAKEEKKKEKKQPTPEQIEQEKQDAFTAAAGEDLLDAMRRGDTKAERRVVDKYRKKVAPKKPPKDPKLKEVDYSNTPIDKENKQLMDSILDSVVSGNKDNATTRNLIKSLENEKARQDIAEYLETYKQERERVKEKWDELSTISDEDSAVSFLTEGLGYEMRDGKIRRPLEPNRWRRALGGAGMPGEGRTEPRGILFDEIQAMGDPEWKEMMDSAEEDNGKSLHANAIKNDISWDMATKVYEKLDGDLQSTLNSWGAPKSEFGVFSPNGPVEYLKDGDGNFTGETNIDLLRKTNPEEYEAQFSDRPNKQRGIFLLQRLLMNGGRDEFTNLPTFYDFDSMSPDHIFGRSKGDLDNGIKKDAPMNLSLTRRGINQYKVPGGDSVPGLAKRASNVSTPLGKINQYDMSGEEDFTKNPEFMKWVSYRASQKDFNVKNEKISELPTTFEQVSDLSDDDIKTLVSDHNKSNIIGLGMRNLSMMNPRPGNEPGKLSSPNTWGGQPAKNSYGYEPLSDFRRTLITNAMFDPDIQEELNSYSEGLKPSMSEEDRQAAIAKKRAQISDFRHFRPQKAIGSLYSMGRITTDQFVDRLMQLGESNLQFMKETNPKQYKEYITAMRNSMESYRSRLKRTFGDRPYQYPDEELATKLNSPYINSIMGSNYGRSMMPKELVDAFDQYAEDMAAGKNGRKSTQLKKLKDNLVEDMPEPKDRDIIERLRSSLGKRVNGKTFI